MNVPCVDRKIRLKIGLGNPGFVPAVSSAVILFGSLSFGIDFSQTGIQEIGVLIAAASDIVVVEAQWKVVPLSR